MINDNNKFEELKKIRKKISNYKWSIAKEIKIARKRQGLSQEGLASLLELSRATIGRIEQGIDVDADKILLVAFALELLPEDILNYQSTKITGAIDIIRACCDEVEKSLK